MRIRNIGASPRATQKKIFWQLGWGGCRQRVTYHHHMRSGEPTNETGVVFLARTGFLLVAGGAGVLWQQRINVKQVMPPIIPVCWVEMHNATRRTRNRWSAENTRNGMEKCTSGYDEFPLKILGNQGFVHSHGTTTNLKLFIRAIDSSVWSVWAEFGSALSLEEN